MQATTDEGKKVILHNDGTWSEATAPSPAANLDDSGAGFRKALWGSNKAAIIASESGDPDSEAPNSLRFNTRVAGLSAVALYLFVEDQLVRAKYLIREKYQNKNSYITDFDRLTEALTTKYGTPDRSNTFWKNDMFRGDWAAWGTAVSIGHLSRFEGWITEETLVLLVLTGENYEVDLQVEYSSTKFKDLESEHNQAAILADL